MKQYIVRESSTGRVFFVTLPAKAGPDEVYHQFARVIYNKDVADTGDVDIDVYELPAKPPRGGTVREAFTN